MSTSLLKSINGSINKATEFLYRSQLPSGNFPNYNSVDRKMEKDCKFENCIFSSTIIAYCMGFLNSEKTLHIVNKIRRFLIDEIIYPGIWSYLSSQDSSTIIPDIDDTCCASFILKDSHPWISKGKNIPLILNNRNKDGLFYTWINLFPQAKDMNDVDSVVNANLLFYLGEREETRRAEVPCPSFFLVRIGSPDNSLVCRSPG